MDALNPEGQASLDQLNQIKEDVDLLQYIFALANAKWLIVTVAAICGVIALLYAKQQPDIYIGIARTDIHDIRDPGGVKPDSRRAQEAIGMLEHGFVLEARKDNYTDVMLLRMKSHSVVRHFLDKYNIYRYLFPNDWDEQSQQWRQGFELDKGWAEKVFKDDILAIGHDPATDIVAIKMTYTNATIAADLANLYVHEFNEFMRNETLEKTQRKIEYIEQNVTQTRVIEIQKMLFRLMEAQTAAAMLAQARKDYILEVLDPAIPPINPSAPNRKLIAVLGAIGGALVTISVVILVQMLGGIQAAIETYRHESGRKPVSKRYFGLRAWAYKLFTPIRRLIRRK